MHVKLSEQMKALEKDIQRMKEIADTQYGDLPPVS